MGLKKLSQKDPENCRLCSHEFRPKESTLLSYLSYREGFSDASWSGI